MLRIGVVLMFSVRQRHDRLVHAFPVYQYDLENGPNLVFVFTGCDFC